MGNDRVKLEDERWSLDAQMDISSRVHECPTAGIYTNQQGHARSLDR